jgi:hypothetical protein
VDGNEHDDELDDMVDENLYDADDSLDWFMSPMKQLSTLQDIHNSKHLHT